MRGKLFCGEASNNLSITGHALGPNFILGLGGEQGAARFVFVLAVPKAAQTEKGSEFDEASQYLFAVHIPQRKLPDTRRIDKAAAVREMVKPSGRGGVSALGGGFRQCANTGVGTGQQAVN